MAPRIYISASEPLNPGLVYPAAYSEGSGE